MRSNVNVVNHPIHPILVLIPVGAWITSFIFDIIFISTGNTFWFLAALWTMIIGIVGALIAAVAGMWDLFTLPLAERPKRVGLTHMTLNLIIVALYVINVIIRFSVPTSPIAGIIVPASTVMWAFILNLVAVVLLLVSGWYGGELIYRYGIAVPDETCERASESEAQPITGEPGIAGYRGGETPPHEEE